MSEAVKVSVGLAEAMKQGMRQWASGVAIISAKAPDGSLHAMTASSLTSVSDNPPSLLVCVNQSARMAEILKPNTLFCVNILTQAQQQLSNTCANPTKQNERFNDASWNITGIPRLNSAAASFECKAVKCVAQGTHNIVIGEISAVYLNAQSTQPLCYWNGAYAALANATEK